MLMSVHRPSVLQASTLRQAGLWSALRAPLELRRTGRVYCPETMVALAAASILAIVEPHAALT